MTRILITGSKGLIGKPLIRLLEKAGVTVNQFDIKFPKEHIFFGDILDTDALRYAVKDCDGIVHLAAVSRVVWGEQNPNLCTLTNVSGTQQVLQAAYNASKKPWVLFSSSREVYGQQKHLPVKITAPYQPMNVYARSKVAAEKAVLQARKLGLQTAIVRYSNVYGSVFDHETRVVPAFCRASVMGNVLKVEGNNNTFDFTHLEDTVNGTINIISKLINGVEDLPPLHLTTGVPTTLGELAQMACKANENKSAIIEAVPRSFDVAAFYGDVIQTKKLIDWSAKISIKDGVSSLVKEFKNHTEKLL
jgi:UDP-glucose 4-epimerase